MSKSLDYIELICKLSPNSEKNRNLLIEHLSFEGFESFMETSTGINAYIPQNLFNRKLLPGLKKRFSNFRVELSVKLIKDENWNETWTKNYFEPIVFGSRLVVRASFHKTFPAAENEIIIDPKTAFGTGYHATTYMLLEEILELNVKGKSVLDMGTGTGILAILSKMQGSAYTLAVDNDTKSVTNTSENISVNNTPDIKVVLGDITVLKNEQFDIIYENIWKNIVISDLPILAKQITPEGVILTSGFYYKDYEDVKKAGEASGLKFESVKAKDGWAIVKFKNKK